MQNGDNICLDFFASIQTKTVWWLKPFMQFIFSGSECSDVFVHVHMWPPGRQRKKENIWKGSHKRIIILK